MALPALGRLLDRLARRELPVWYSPLYRLPLSGTDVSVGMHPRRADRVVWWLPCTPSPPLLELGKA